MIATSLEATFLLIGTPIFVAANTTLTIPWLHSPPPAIESSRCLALVGSVQRLLVHVTSSTCSEATSPNLLNPPPWRRTVNSRISLSLPIAMPSSSCLTVQFKARSMPLTPSRNSKLVLCEKKREEEEEGRSSVLISFFPLKCPAGKSRRIGSALVFGNGGY